MSSSCSSFLYVSGYTEDMPHVQNAQCHGISLYRITEIENSENLKNFGNIRFEFVSGCEMIDAGRNPSFLAISSDERYIFVANEQLSQGTISVLKATGDINKRQYQKVQTVACDSCYVRLDSSGRRLLSAGYYAGTASVFQVNESDGTLTEEWSRKFDHFSGKVKERQEHSHVHCFALDPSEKFAYITDLGGDRLYRYKFEGGGILKDSEKVFNFPLGTGPRHIAFHRNGRFVFVNGELSNQLFVFQVDDEGMLNHLQDITTLPEEHRHHLNGSADLHLTPDCRYLYVSNRSIFPSADSAAAKTHEDTIAIYSVGVDGRVALIGHQSVKGRIPRNFTIDPNGRFLVVANQDISNIVAFRIENNGLLRYCGEISSPTPAYVKWINSK